MNIFEKIMKRLEEESDYEPIEYDCDDTGCVDEQKFIATDEAKKIVQEVAEEYNNGWIPCSERFPDTDKYILLSFSNFSIPLVGRYEEDEDGSGSFYIGDEMETCLSQDLFVNAWMYLPEPYKESENE